MTECTDPKCPHHGGLKTRGRSFAGRVVSDKMQRSVTIEIERSHFIKKYQRYEKRYTKFMAHNPECVNAKQGQLVLVSECRPLSKAKSFVVMKVLETEK